ncbi:MAG TPA: hypothetical protein VFE47_05420 [Tepidisphaeraceae bacterium]|jgi:hypothetical protein|nr:hypothetical protein [Tepidisphaeraceae bacterium]
MAGKIARIFRKNIALLPILFCLLNWGWSLGGGWAIQWSGDHYYGHDQYGCCEDAWESHGAASQGGCLTIAIDYCEVYGINRAIDRKSAVFFHQSFGWRGDYFFQPGNTAICRVVLPNFSRGFRHGDSGFGWDWSSTRDMAGSYQNRGIAISWLYLGLLFAAIPVLRRMRRWQAARRRQRAGCCRKCGYDARATRDRCPECGTVNAT